MSDLLFTCPNCSINLAANDRGEGKTINCPDCQTTTVIPKPSIFFKCPSCNCELSAPYELAGKNRDCPNCQKQFPIPYSNAPGYKLTCPSCKVIIDIDDGDYSELSETTIECPECKGEISVPKLIPSSSRLQLKSKATTGRKCSSCGQGINEDAVLCINCGTNQVTGLRIRPITEGVRTSTKRTTSLVSASCFGVVILLIAVGSVIYANRHDSLTSLPQTEPLKVVIVSSSNTVERHIPDGIIYTDDYFSAIATTTVANNNMTDIVVSACSGNISNQYVLGIAYLTGGGVPVNPKLSFDWFSRSANQGHPDAEFFLGSAYFSGRGVAANHEKARLCLEKGAQKGSAMCQNELGQFYIDGIGGESNTTKAVQLLTQAAQQGNAQAQCRLGECYYHGVGVKADLLDAETWLSLGVDQGYQNATGTLRRLTKDLYGLAKQAFSGTNKAQFRTDPKLFQIANVISKIPLSYPTIEECSNLLIICSQLENMTNTYPRPILAAIRGSELFLFNELEMNKQGYRRYTGRWMTDEEISLQRTLVADRIQNTNNALKRKQEESADSFGGMSRPIARNNISNIQTLEGSPSSRKGGSYWSSTPQREAQFHNIMNQAFGAF